MSTPNSSIGRSERGHSADNVVEWTTVHHCSVCRSDHVSVKYIADHLVSKEKRSEHMDLRLSE